MQLSRDDLVGAYRTMRTIRMFEDRVHDEFAAGKIPGFVHLYAGEEASAVGVCLDLTDKDSIASTHRGHGHCIAKGCDVGAMMKEIYGRRDGLCGGKGGSMHIAALKASRWRITDTARLLGVSRSTVHHRINRYGLSRPV